MSISEFTAKAKVRSHRRSYAAAGVVVGVVASILMPTSTLNAGAQIPKPAEPNLEKLESLFNTRTSTGIVPGEVRLDGYELFQVAAPVVGSKNEKQQNATTPVDQRVEGIEDTLNRIVNSNIKPEAIRVTAEIDQRSGLPVITINDQYLMTVTTLDAGVQGEEDLTRLADKLAQQVEDALIRAKRERQTEFLIRQGLLASGITLTMILGSWGTTRLQRRLKAQKEDIEAQFRATPELETALEDGQEPNAIAPNRLQTIEVVQQQLENRQLRNLNDIQRRLLQVGQVVLWGGGTFAILGLFPYTRWLQPLVLSGPLKVFGIGVITYVVIRASAVLIDRFFAALQDGEFLAPEASQRLALRVSTFSQISKSITAIGCIGVGGLVALSVVGVDVIPLLAGAGIIGLAISFASQSLIKDMINGFLILFEDQYAVGDVIVVDKVGGLVENMTLRITQLRDTEGKLITLPNGSITVVQNLSKDWSRVDLTIEVAYGADLDYALDVIKQVGQQMFSDRDWNGKILEQPDVLGVDKIEHTGILIRVWIKTQPLQQWSVGREFRRRLKNAFDQAGVAIGVPQQSLWFSNSLDMLAHRRLTNGDGHQPRQLIGHSDDAN